MDPGSGAGVTKKTNPQHQGVWCDKDARMRDAGNITRRFVMGQGCGLA